MFVVLLLLLSHECVAFFHGMAVSECVVCSVFAFRTCSSCCDLCSSLSQLASCHAMASSGHSVPVGSSEEAEHQIRAIVRWCRFMLLLLEELHHDAEWDSEQMDIQIYPGPRRLVPGLYSRDGMYSAIGEPLASNALPAETSTDRSGVGSTALQSQACERSRTGSAAIGTLNHPVPDASVVSTPTKRLRKRCKTKS